jgi:hypothetical protein
MYPATATENMRNQIQHMTLAGYPPSKLSSWPTSLVVGRQNPLPLLNFRLWMGLARLSPARLDDTTVRLPHPSLFSMGGRQWVPPKPVFGARDSSACAR